MVSSSTPWFSFWYMRRLLGLCDRVMAKVMLVGKRYITSKPICGKNHENPAWSFTFYYPIHRSGKPHVEDGSSLDLWVSNWKKPLSSHCDTNRRKKKKNYVNHWDWGLLAIALTIYWLMQIIWLWKEDTKSPFKM